ncbi:MAG TPA: hypothetical protein VGS79_11065, partial [Puia sp.]|nr:hypothetical protein [Puia sp.]
SGKCRKIPAKSSPEMPRRKRSSKWLNEEVTVGGINSLHAPGFTTGAARIRGELQSPKNKIYIFSNLFP